MKNHYVLLCLLVTILTQAQTYKIVYDEYYNDKLITNTNLLVLYTQKNNALQVTELASKKFTEISTYYNFIENNQVKK